MRICVRVRVSFSSLSQYYWCRWKWWTHSQNSNEETSASCFFFLLDCIFLFGYVYFFPFFDWLSFHDDMMAVDATKPITYAYVYDVNAYRTSVRSVKYIKYYALRWKEGYDYSTVFFFFFRASRWIVNFFFAFALVRKKNNIRRHMVL